MNIEKTLEGAKGRLGRVVCGSRPRRELERVMDEAQRVASCAEASCADRSEASELFMDADDYYYDTRDEMEDC